MKKCTFTRMGVLVLIMVLINFILPVHSIGAETLMPPEAFWGKLTHTDGTPAAPGSVVSAAVNGKAAGSLTTTQAGQYGNEYKGYAKLIVQGDFAEGAIVKFYVNGIPAIALKPGTADEITVVFESNLVANVDLTYNPPSPTTTTTKTTTTHSGGSGGGFTRTLTPTPTPTASPATSIPAATSTPASSLTVLNIDLDGNKSSLNFSNNGIIQQSLTIGSPDKTLELKISSGTKISGSSGVLTDISIKPVGSQPPPTSNYDYLLKAYDCQPEGISFDPPVALVFHFNLPDGVDPSALKAGTYSDGYWKFLAPDQFAIDAANRTLTIKISHFSYYAIFAPIPSGVSSSISTAPISPSPAAESNLIIWITCLGIIVVLVLVIVLIARRKSLRK
jgi:hypothetical protein